MSPGIIAVVVIAVLAVLVVPPILHAVFGIDFGAPAILCGTCETGLEVSDAVVIGLVVATILGTLIVALGSVVIATGTEKADEKGPYVDREQRRRARRDRVLTGVAILIIGAVLVGLAPLVGAAAGPMEASPSKSPEPTPAPSSSTTPAETGSDTGEGAPGYVVCPSGCTIVPLPTP